MSQSLVIITLLFLFFCACGNTHQTINANNPNNLHKMENEEKLTLHKGDVHQVTLQSRGATGLQLLYKCDDDSIVEIKRVEYSSSDSAKLWKDNIGGPIPAVFEISAMHEGATKITFYETRSWEKNFKPIIQKIITVEVSN
jgi:predicted secreted protein